MNRIDDFFERIKGQQPCLEDADSVTDAIMARIEESAVQENSAVKSVPLWRVLLGGTFSAAAAVVVGLFIVMHDAAVPQENQVAYNMTDNDVYDRIKECRTAADVYALYSEGKKSQSAFNINFAMIKNMYYEKAK